MLFELLFRILRKQAHDREAPGGLFQHPHPSLRFCVRIARRRPQAASSRFYHQNPSEIRLEGFYDVARTTPLSSVSYCVMGTEANEITYNIAERRD